MAILPRGRSPHHTGLRILDAPHASLLALAPLHVAHLFWMAQGRCFFPGVEFGSELAPPAMLGSWGLAACLDYGLHGFLGPGRGCADCRSALYTGCSPWGLILNVSTASLEMTCLNLVGTPRSCILLVQGSLLWACSFDFAGTCLCFEAVMVCYTMDYMSFEVLQCSM